MSYLMLQCVPMPQRFSKRVNTLLDFSTRGMNNENAGTDKSGLASRVRCCLAARYEWLRENKSASRRSQAILLDIVSVLSYPALMTGTSLLWTCCNCYDDSVPSKQDR